MLTKIEKLFRAVFPAFHPTRWTPFRKIFLKSVNILRSETIHTILGFKLEIPKDDYSFYIYFLWRFGLYEKESTELVKSILRKGDVAIDVGANIGYYSCLFSESVSSSGVVHSFEPEDKNFKRLENNLKLNGYSWANAHKLALSDRSGKHLIYKSSENRGDHTLVKIDGRETESIEMLTLDDFLKEKCCNKNIRLLKIDVQGFEAKVFEGMKDSLLDERFDNIIIEFTPYRITKAGDEPLEILKSIEESKYQFSILSKTVEEKYLSVNEIITDLDKLKTNEFAAFDFLLSRKKL